MRRRFPVGSLLGLGVAALALTYMHLMLSDRVNPVRQTVSDYVRSGAWAAWLNLTVLGLACAVLAIIGGLCAADSRRFRLVSVLLGSSVVGLVGMALFPTGPVGSVSTPAGELHRWSVTLSFLSVPCAGRVLARQLGGATRRRVARLSTLSVGFLAVLLVSYLPVVFPSPPGRAAWSSPA